MEDENSTFAKIFDDNFQSGLSKALINAGVNKMKATIEAGGNPIGVVHFTQCDTNGKKHSTLCVEARTKEWANFAENVTFTYEGITFVGKTMAKWLQDLVMAVKWTGKIIAVNMGPPSVWDIVFQSCMHGGILSHQDPARADPLSGIRPGSWPALGLLTTVPC